MNGLDFSTITVRDNIVFNFDSVKQSIALDFESSSEASYWKKRSSNNFKRVESYRSFNSRRNRKSKKRLCENGIEFKRAKRWYGYEERYMDYEAYSYEVSDYRKALPYRNKVYCSCCGKNKILFQDKSKADNFIKFNSESILAENGYAPIRSYYCSLCGGWHVTSLVEDHERNLSNIPCLAERVVMSIIEMKSPAKVTKPFEQHEEIKNSEDTISEILKEIKVSFNREMESFFTAYRNKDLSSCKEIHCKMKRMFSDCTLPYKEIDKIKKRILDAQVNIDKLNSILQKEEEEKKMLIWGIQKVFREEYDKFKHAYALRKLDDCYTIYMKMAKAINESGIQLPFIKAIKIKLNNMMQCLEILVNSRMNACPIVSSSNNAKTQYLDAV